MNTFYKPGPYALTQNWRTDGTWEVNEDRTQFKYHPPPGERPEGTWWPFRGVHGKLPQLLSSGAWVPLYPESIALPEGV